MREIRTITVLHSPSEYVYVYMYAHIYKFTTTVKGKIKFESSNFCLEQQAIRMVQIN